jgi:two-component system, cell cycle sensor histidine kinase and response regulator CckA
MAGIRILVVDDERMVLESVRMTLVHYGYSVEAACGGPEALAALHSSEFALVITDRKMPGMSGDQLAKEIKAQFPGLPVVLLTGYPPDRKPPGVDVVLLKPFSTQELRGVIEALLRKKEG